MGFSDPALEINAWGRNLGIRALNQRGALPLEAISSCIQALTEQGVIADVSLSENEIDVTIAEPGGYFTEEQRSRQPSVFSALREII